MVAAILAQRRAAGQRRRSVFAWDKEKPQSAGIRSRVSDLSRRCGELIAEALRGPVTLIQRNRPRLVLLMLEDDQRLSARTDTRSVGTLETMPDALFDVVSDAVAAYEGEPDAP